MEKWVVTAKKADFHGLARQFSLDPLTIRLLVNRGADTPEKIRRFLSAGWQDEYDPRRMKGAQEAAERILETIRRGEKIRIASDFDVDGIFSGQILQEALREAGGDVDVQAPDRRKEGYGVNRAMVERAWEEGIRTLVTCDNGIAAFDAVSRAKELGMQVIVTDHHACQYEEKDGEKVWKLPEADVIVNPHQPGCPYPFKGLCGAGVAYKVVEILYDLCGFPRERSLRFLEYAAIATVADVMDLTDENRILVKEGLRRLPGTKNAGLAALIRVCGLEGKPITAYHIGFILGPCFNSAGRLDTVEQAFRLLSGREGEVYPLAERLKELNENRKALTRQGVEQAEAWLGARKTLEDILVIPLPDCHESVAGIVAGRIRERYHRPSIVLTRAEQGWKGSGRSIEAWDMFEGLLACRPLLTRFGGHPMAAGLSLEEDKIDILREQVNQNTGLTEDDFLPIIRIDAPMPPGYITEERIREISLLEPFGKGNPRPLFAEKHFRFLSARVLGANRNVLKLSVEHAGGIRMDALYFGDPEEINREAAACFGAAAVQALYRGEPGPVEAALVYYPEVNEFRGMRTLQLVVQHIRFTKNDGG